MTKECVLVCVCVCVCNIKHCKTRNMHVEIKTNFPRYVRDLLS